MKHIVYILNFFGCLENNIDGTLWYLFTWCAIRIQLMNFRIKTFYCMYYSFLENYLGIQRVFICLDLHEFQWTIVWITYFKTLSSLKSKKLLLTYDRSVMSPCIVNDYFRFMISSDTIRSIFHLTKSNDNILIFIDTVYDYHSTIFYINFCTTHCIISKFSVH